MWPATFVAPSATSLPLFFNKIAQKSRGALKNTSLVLIRSAVDQLVHNFGETVPLKVL
jgi:hypothetical protein